MKLLYLMIDGRLALYWSRLDGWIGYSYNPHAGILYLSLIPTLMLAVVIDFQKYEEFEREYYS